MTGEIWQKFKLVDVVFVVGLGLVVAGIGIGVKDKFNSPTKVEVVKKDETQVYSEVRFDIAGAVMKPGVYSLAKDSRINEALVAAGGLSAKADRDWVDKNINKAERIIDGMKIYIPETGEMTIQAENTSGKAEVKGATNSKISLNNGTIEDFDKLSGIGPAIGQRIIDYRQKVGGFKSIEEIKLVAGVGDKLYDKIKDQISL